MEIRQSAASVLRRVFAVAVVLIVLSPVQGTTSDDGGATKTGTAARPGDSAGPAALQACAPCTTPCEPNAPSPATGATDVPVDTDLSWNVPAPKGCYSFRLLASSGGLGGDVNPFSLLELATNPVSETPIGRPFSIGFVSSLDSSPNGLLYGMDGEFCLIDPNNGSAQTICEAFYTPDGTPVPLTGIAFHPNGTLYGVDWDSDTDENVVYLIDPGKSTATEICRTSAYRGSAWGIDFSPDGVLYGAFCELVKFDLAKGTSSIVGRRFSLPFVNDIDYAPDGFIYAVDNMEWRLYKIKPSTGLIVDEYGPYSSELWGVASECLLPSCSGQATAALIPSLSAASRVGLRAAQEPAGLWRALGDQWTTTAKRGLMLERRASRRGEIAVEDGARVATAGEASPSLQAAAAEVGSDITCDVYLDTVRPPARLIAQDVPAPAPGSVWTCGHRLLRPGTTYYWMVVAKRPCGALNAGAVWSFTTQGSLPEDTVPSTTSDSTK